MSCKEGTNNCDECHFDEKLNQFICDVCKEDYYMENNKCKKDRVE